MDRFGIRCLLQLNAMSTQPFGGPWTQEKLGILRRYLDAYTTALKKQRFRLIYVDAFAGSGNWRPGTSYEVVNYGEYNEMLKGSPSIALDVVNKPFDQFMFIDTNPANIESLNAVKNENRGRNINVVSGDANIILPKFCRNLGRYDRAVVFLDPYATEVSWATIANIARTEKIDCWLLFPVMAITRQMPLGREPDPALMSNLDRTFGGRKYWHDFYSPVKQPTFWSRGDEMERESGNEKIAEAFRERLRSEFASVAPTRRVLKNSTNSSLFDLFFAASNPVGAGKAVQIADYILNRW